MKLRLVLALCLSASLAMPVVAAPVAIPVPIGIQAVSDVVAVGAKRKKKKPKQVRRNPRNGDVLIGRVDGFNKPDWRNARRTSEGNDLGGLIGQAVNNFMAGRVYSSGGGGRKTGPHEVPMGAQGQNCGVQYWTDTPTSPTC